MEKQAFIDMLMPAALEVSKRTGVDPRIIVAQAAIETGWGQHAPGNNYFGIKSHGQPGGNTLATTEVVNGRPVRVDASFRGYQNPTASVVGYGEFIASNPRYEPFRAAQGLDAQLSALQSSGYATDPNYSRKVGSIARGLLGRVGEQEARAMPVVRPAQYSQPAQYPQPEIEAGTGYVATSPNALAPQRQPRNFTPPPPGPLIATEGLDRRYFQNALAGV